MACPDCCSERPRSGPATEHILPLNWGPTVIQTHVLGREKNDNGPYSIPVSRMKMTKVQIRIDLYTSCTSQTSYSVYMSFLFLKMWMVILTLWRLNKVYFKGLWTQRVLNKYLFFFSKEKCDTICPSYTNSWPQNARRYLKATQNYLLKWQNLVKLFTTSLQ